MQKKENPKRTKGSKLEAQCASCAPKQLKRSREIESRWREHFLN